MSFVLSFQNEHVLYEKNIKCTVKDHEYNYSYNPSLLISGSNQEVKSFCTSSFFSPYVTTVGLYDDSQNLLAVAKFAQPVPLPTEVDISFWIRFDL